MKEKWLINPREASQNGKDNNLIYFIGDEKQPPLMAVHCDKKDKDLWQVTGEDVDGYFFFSVTADSKTLVSEIENAVTKVKNIYYSATDPIEEEVIEEDKDDEEDEYIEIDDDEYFCTNPLCGSYGRIFNPKIDEFGEVVCPECGMPLTPDDDLIDETDRNDNNFDYKEISAILLAFILNNCNVWEMDVHDVIDEIYEYGITSSELQNLLIEIKSSTGEIISY